MQTIEQNNSPPIRALIVDDSPLDRSGLRRFCARHADLELIGECASGQEAIAAIKEHAPTLLFLDIRLGGMDGFRVIEEIGIDRMPFIVFTTAFDEHALKAFDVDAVDYLLKPYDAERFDATMTRIRARMAEGVSARLEARLAKTLANLAGKIRQQASSRPERVVVEKDERLIFLDPGDIDCIEAQRNYVVVHSGPERYLLRCSMKRVEAMLAPGRFLRIQRSVMVNSARIDQLERWFHGEYRVTLRNGMSFTSGRKYRKRILRYVRNQGTDTIGA